MTNFKGCLKSCLEIKKTNPNAKSGYYTIAPQNNIGVQAYCNHDIETGGWTQIATVKINDWVYSTSTFQVTENPSGLAWNELLVLDGGSQLCTWWRDTYCQYGFNMG
jgi:hypothetical protein